MGKFGRNAKVEVKDMLIIASTEKAYGVIPYYNITGRIDPRSVTKWREVKKALELDMIWVPKSQISEERISKCKIFPMLKEEDQPSKIDFIMPLWMANSKGLINGGSTGETMEPDNYDSGW